MPGDKSFGDTERFIWHEGDAEMFVVASQCLICRHFRPSRTTCTAFVNSVPGSIFVNEVDHRQPYEGDGGIRWEPIEPGMEHPMDGQANP